MRLLIAEDDSSLLAVLERGLSRNGYVVDTARRGDDALHLLELNDYAAVVLDWRMPGLDGVEVIAAARRASRTVPILLLTARVTAADRVHGPAAGAGGCPVKPVRFPDRL